MTSHNHDESGSGLDFNLLTIAYQLHILILGEVGYLTQSTI